MTGQADLSGQRVLVVEDDYYLATDTARALKGAGAEVLGPCATEGAARAEIADATPRCGSRHKSAWWALFRTGR
ncbi:hypothetical protein [Rhizobium sp. Root708]|uniref:hypothetical protein n=1 Tax=Rhizobium sp. Root708 TaxID=1736592 RepID=UPI000B0D3B6E|nr:hypothetical protein [Rhizobium sp. Root708]